MAEKLDPKQVVSVEEILRACLPLRAGSPPPGAREEGRADQRRGFGGGQGGEAGVGR